ncbi:MAG: Asp-tRNA(Asn)/Glu-tRNA(Gln) amidotransferase subunit GatB [Bdellovibrionales bacterium]|nr:Asp-tRNA(Asn)/Glu-tRNA(Gln) amidotransferase subunit GatB [Bdellovibrionales bacterium]
MDYESVIGLEVHVQLSTESKIFSGASSHVTDKPNEHVDPVTFGLPGTLPVLNEKVVEFALRLGLALNCDIRRFNRFARKHYFYPDLPKGYQISQYEEPICGHGRLQFRDGEVTRTVGITRIHMEEDAGKSVHSAERQCSLLDLNRAGVPLLEVVSEPDIRSAREAAAYLRALRQLVRYLELSDGNMEEGSLRCDANVSLRPKGEMKFGTRTEIKNLNSFRFVERAIEYEVARQVAILKSGEPIVQETRLFDSESGTTRSMRSKEESADYRYFPDPDLPPLQIEESWINAVRAKLPTLPQEIFQSLIDDYGLSEYDAAVISAEHEYVRFFLEAQEVCKNPKATCNWITSEIFGALKQHGEQFSELRFSPLQLGQLIALIDQDVISGKIAKTVFEELYASGGSPNEIIERRGLKQITDDSAIREMVKEALRSNPEQVAQFREGNAKLLGFFVGQVMKLSKGSANPKLVNDILLEELKS